MTDVPKGLAPYISLGVELSQGTTDNWIGDCPLCSSEGKLSVEATTSKFRCWSCEAGGNASVFVELLWKALDDLTTDYTGWAEELQLEATTLMQWGAVWNHLISRWCMPGFNESGNVRNLYRYAAIKGGKRTFLGTSTLGQQMYGVNLYDAKKKHVMLTEGAKDAMRLWEHLGQCRWKEENLVRTASSGNLLADTNVIGLPGCTTFYPKWGNLLAGKQVTIMFDNDHDRPHPESGKTIESGALQGIKRLVRALTSSSTPPENIHYIRWGDVQDYYRKDLPHGYDIGDNIKVPRDV